MNGAGDLPPFLQPCPPLPGRSSTSATPYANAIFQHKRPSSSAHSLWWASAGECETCLIFIPGNPGLLEFYTPFLTAIHEKSRQRICILAHAHVGHITGLDGNYQDPSIVGLTAQIEAVIETVDAVKTTYRKIVIAGHSVGAWITLQALKARQSAIDSVFLLFPTIMHIAKTPNGRQLSWAFKQPFPRFVSWISVATRLVPSRGLKYLFSDWPDAQLAVLRSLLDSPNTIYACLTMAHEEMKLITDLDVDSIQRNRHILHLYLAEIDSWIGEYRTAIIEAFQPDEGNLKIVHGREDIPHAFCINHGEELAEQCHKWLEESGFL